MTHRGDRRPAAWILAATVTLVFACGCDEDEAEEAAPAQGPSRFVSVAKKDEGRSPEAFCDSYTPGEGASAFEPPPLAGGNEMPDEGWRWVNIWATWCKPCIEEMPLLAEWHDELEKEGADFELIFLSVDDSAEIVEEYRNEHPETPETFRIDNMDALPEFLASLGLDENTPIPIQILVSPESKIRCVRAGAVSRDDYSAVEEILL